MSIRNVCVRAVDVAKPDESAWQAAERMHQRSVGTLVVVNDDQRPVGIVTDRDLVERVISPNRDASSTSISDVMTTDPRTVTEDDSIESALLIMSADECRRLIVIDDDGRLGGLVSMDDILKKIIEEMVLIDRLLERQTPQAVAELNR